MFERHNPRIWKSLIMIGIGIAGIALTGYIRNVTVFYSVCGGGGIILILGILEASAVYYGLVVENQERLYRTQVDIIEALSNSDAEVRNAIGLWFPQYDFQWAGNEAIITWQGTDVPYKTFREFMLESNDTQIIAQRAWKERGVEFHRWWMIIYSKLKEFEMVIPDSHAGSHSELWRGHAYKRAWEMWIMPLLKIEALDQQ